MNITSDIFSFNVGEWFLHSSVLKQTESDLSKIHSNSIGALGQVSIVSHSYQTYFSFLGLVSILIMGCMTTWSRGSPHFEFCVYHSPPIHLWIVFHEYDIYLIYGIYDKGGVLEYFYWSVMSYRSESDIQLLQFELSGRCIIYII
jgi:hypothetical protein